MYMQALKPDVSTDFCPAKLQECTVDQFVRLGNSTHPEPTFFHSFYNHHAETFEMVESKIRHGLLLATQPIQNCASCASAMLHGIADYIDEQV
jgi:hypothetical protein